MKADSRIYRFRLHANVPMAEVRESLKLAILAAEGLHGAAQVRLDFAYCADDEKRTLVLEARGEAGIAVIRMFTGFLSQQIGETGFRVERVALRRDADTATPTHAATGG